MPKLFPCYSPTDRELAHELASFLERGAGVEVLLEEGEIQPGEDLVAKVEEGLSADVVLALFSPDSVPARWILERWKFAFWEHAAEVNTPVASLLCHDCKFPDLLRRKNFFDLRTNRLAAFRAIKRWLMALWPPPQRGPFVPAQQPSFKGRDAELENLCARLADAPSVAVVSNASSGAGKTALALEFALRHQDDFESILWLSCSSRTTASLAGDLAAQLGARSDRDLESVLNSVRQLCARHRFLLVLDDASAETAAAFVSRGRSSVLVTTSQPDLAAALSAESLIIEADGIAPPAAVLDGTDKDLFNAMCACAPSGFRIEIPARMTGIDMPAALKIAGRLATAGHLTTLDHNGTQFIVADPARVPTEGEASRLAHAQACIPSDLAGCWPDLRHALAWALSANWPIACTLARRGIAWARAQDRIAEAFEIVEDWSRVAEARADRNVLRDCAWEQIWILEHWGRDDEARQLEKIRRENYADQMAFEF